MRNECEHRDPQQKGTTYNLRLMDSRMKEKKLTIVIDRPVEEIYHFITNPSYTHLWFDSIREEFSDHYPPQVGTKYTNR